MKLKPSVLFILVSGLLTINIVILIKDRKENLAHEALKSTYNELVFKSVPEKEYKAASPFIKRLINKLDASVTALNMIKKNSSVKSQAIIFISRDTNEKNVLTSFFSNGENLPTLENYLSIGTKSNPSTLMICEIKEALTGAEISQKTTMETLALAENLGISEKIIYISFGFEIVKTIKRLQPNAIVLYLENNKTINEIVNEKINGINYHFSNFMNDSQLSVIAKQNNLLMGSWTVNKIEDLNKLIAQGVEYITTNEPAQFLALVSKK